MIFKAYLENKRNTSKAVSPFEMIVWFILLYLFLGSIYIHALTRRCRIILYCWKESNLIIAYSLLMFWIQFASIFNDLFGGGCCVHVRVHGTICDFLGSNWSHQAWQWVSALCYLVSLSVHSCLSEDFCICVHQGNQTIISLPSVVLG